MRHRTTVPRAKAETFSPRRANRGKAEMLPNVKIMGAVLSETAASSSVADLPDTELVEAARRGSQAAFAEVVKRHQGLVYSLVYALTGSITQSEEVAQETFVTAWKRLGDVDPPRFRAWLCGIARILTRNSRRKQRKLFSLGSVALTRVDVASADPSPLERAISNEEEVVLWRALGKIPEFYRVPLVLFYQEGKSIQRVGEALAVSEAAIKKRLWKGRKLLQANVTVALESALERSRPKVAFTAAVMAAIATVGTAGGAEAAGRLGKGRRTSWMPADKAPVLVGAMVLLPIVGVLGVVGLGLGKSRSVPRERGLSPISTPGNVLPVSARLPRLTAFVAPRSDERAPAAPEETAGAPLPILIDFET